MNNTDASSGGDGLGLSRLRAALPSRSLRDVVSTLQQDLADRKSRYQRVKPVFEKLRDAFLKSDMAAEELLFSMNTPPHLNEAVEPYAPWIEVSSDIFGLSPVLGDGFASALLENCVSIPTHLAFCLSHSEVMEVMVRNNAASISFDPCKEVIPAVVDSRAVYALHALKWYPHWDEIKLALFDCFLSTVPVVSNAAYWALRSRATVDDLKELSARRGLAIASELDTGRILKELVRVRQDK